VKRKRKVFVWLNEEQYEVLRLLKQRKEIKSISSSIREAVGLFLKQKNSEKTGPKSRIPNLLKGRPFNIRFHG